MLLPLTELPFPALNHLMKYSAFKAQLKCPLFGKTFLDSLDQLLSAECLLPDVHIKLPISSFVSGVETHSPQKCQPFLSGDLTSWTSECLAHSGHWTCLKVPRFTNGKKEDIRRYSLYSTKVCPKFCMLYSNKNWKMFICLKLTTSKNKSWMVFKY